MTRHQNNIKYYKKKLNMRSQYRRCVFHIKLWENALSNTKSGIYKKTNTAEKRLRMRQPYRNSIANLMRSRSERFRRLKMAVKRSDFIVRLYSQISSAKINMSF